jgi:hypothetical protein
MQVYILLTFLLCRHRDNEMKEMDTMTRGPFLSCYAGILTFQVHREGDEEMKGPMVLSCPAMQVFLPSRYTEKEMKGPMVLSCI